MKQGMIEYGRTRRQIRKANREARVDHQAPKRTFIKVLLVLCAIIFVIIEFFSITFAKRIHDRDLAKDLANEATIELSMINASLISGDQKLLKDAHQQYQTTLGQFNANSYIVGDYSELLQQLNDYDSVLSAEEKDAHLIKLHTAILMLQKEMQDVDSSKVSTKSMIDIKENLEDFRNSLEELNDARFADAITELTNYSNDLIKLIDKTSVCVGTCSEKTIKSRQTDLANIFEKYRTVLVNCDTKISQFYSPAELVESLKMLQ